MAGDGARPFGRTAGRAVIALLATVPVVIAVLWYLREEPPRPTDTRGFACGYQGDDGRQYCDRLARELARRTAVSPGRVDALDAHLSGVIGAAATRDPWCGPSGVECSRRADARPPTAADVVAARASLARVGFPDAVVRLARRDDPAPAGSLLYAVRVESACVVGHVEGIPRGFPSPDGRQAVLGLLPGGRCVDE